MHIFYLLLSILIFHTEIGLQSLNTVDNFTLTNATDGSSFSLSTLKSSPAIVVIFTSNHCPYDKLYHSRLSKLMDTYQARNVKFVLINSNDPGRSPENTVQQMAKRIKGLRWNVPYLIDANREVASRFGARKNPEAYVLQYRDNTFQVLYGGSIDDNPQVAADVSDAYLSSALDAVLAGKPVLVNETHATRCMIK